VTYNQLITEITNLLQSHAQIKEVKNQTASEWLNQAGVPDFPVALFSINSGTINKGSEQVWSVQFFFLDKSGADREFEPDVISDQWQIAEDIVQLMRGTRRDYYVDDQVTITPISDKYEDYLAGVTYTITITSQRQYDGCDVPTTV